MFIRPNSGIYDQGLSNSFMCFLPFSILLFSTLSSLCQAAQAPLPKAPFPVESLKTLVLEKYPRSILYNISKSDASDLDFAATLGTYLFLHESQLLFTQDSDILIDAAKLEKVVFEELIGAQVDIRNPLSSLQKRMGVFVERILDTVMLKTELTLVEKNENGLRLSKLSDLHMLFGGCALNQLALVSIDVAILKWVVLSARNEMIKPQIFNDLWYPIVDSFLCNSLISLMFHPGVNLHVDSELNEYMGLLKGLPKGVFDSYGNRITSLLLPLPAKYHKPALTKLLSECRLVTFVNENPNVHLPDMLISFEQNNVDRLRKLREDYKMRIFLGASMEFLRVGFQTDSLNASYFNFLYSGTLINDQFENEGLLVAKKFESTTLSIRASRFGEGRDVLVWSFISLTADVLRVLNLYARDVVLSDKDRESLLYAQAAFGISMISAPHILISEGCY